MEDEKIYIVYLWVDGSDQEFQKELKKYSGEETFNSEEIDISPKRYRDNDELGLVPPEEINGIRNDLLAKKLYMKDYDVIDAFEKSFEFIFPAVEKNKTVSLRARIEGKRISEIPFTLCCILYLRNKFRV